MAGDSQFRTAASRSACAAGLLSPNIDTAREKAGKTGTPFKATPEFYEKVRPLLQPIDKSCDCFLRNVVETVGKTLDQITREEGAALMVQFIQSGKCPDPFADHGGGGRSSDFRVITGQAARYPGAEKARRLSDSGKAKRWPT
jgi:hypothetical protein